MQQKANKTNIIKKRKVNTRTEEWRPWYDILTPAKKKKKKQLNDLTHLWAACESLNPPAFQILLNKISKESY